MALAINNINYNNLHDVDWDFADASQEMPSKLHPYPARFIENIPRTLIDVLGCPKGSVVFDPFCGSGTTLFEAQCLGYDSIGVDLNPIACLLSKVKTRSLPSLFTQAYLMVHTKALSAYCENHYIPAIPNLDHWFKKEVQIALSTIMSEIALQQDEEIREALQLALSSIIVRVSNQDSDTRYTQQRD
jgi:site-specific DNA-methyltransferase (cytosine-N4-specific)